MAEQNDAEKTIQGLQYMQQVYQSQYEAITNETSLLVEYINDLNMTKSTIEHREKLKSAGLLSPIGSKAFINATISENTKFIINVGANYFAEQTAEEALQTINRKIEGYTEQFQSLIKARSEVENALYDIAAKLENILKQE
ncbi:prefoldin subunit alpha [Candidatus Marsarchaeota archaeon]|nr:prefoldin subunit alpha [Candidatus Marsarchaeota archaeon]MCL5404951.1 prefoldin subunit alpha [Candidatus Marsarchaeota archaeon]